MAVPKKKSSKARKRKRRSHDALTLPKISKCAKTGLPKLSHRVCEESGFYGKNKQVFEVEERL
ncbi:MAG: 50S ribosomal protein L32 [Planctomycetes bacterium]|nr:50S ribosomal protein L32 [Planctomycetota bacterium]MCA8937595.1 50S ribosomal protein L32 [Planctomycetota bacterium]MCA8947542.1 50S ribosomal protein L32 [Planctomycetota bacterium]